MIVVERFTGGALTWRFETLVVLCCFATPGAHVAVRAVQRFLYLTSIHAAEHAGVLRTAVNTGLHTNSERARESRWDESDAAQPTKPERMGFGESISEVCGLGCMLSSVLWPLWPSALLCTSSRRRSMPRALWLHPSEFGSAASLCHRTT